MLPMEPRIGAHLPLGDGMVRAVERAAEIGATTLQVFANLARARAMFAGQALEPFPAAAFQLRARRSRGSAPRAGASDPELGPESGSSESEPAIVPNAAITTR